MIRGDGKAVIRRTERLGIAAPVGRIHRWSGSHRLNGVPNERRKSGMIGVPINSTHWMGLNATLSNVTFGGRFPF